MNTRGILVVLLLAVGVAACGSAEAATPAGEVLRYAYEPGSSLAYSLEASMDVDMAASGDAAAAAAMDADMVMTISARLELAFASGPTPDTVEITVSQDILDGGAHMVTMGQEMLIPLEDLAAGMEQEVVIVVDHQGRPVSATVGGIALPAQWLSGGSTFGSGSLLTPQQFGPEFPETGLAVGAEWTTEQSAAELGLTFRQVGRHRVAAREELAGRSVYRIDSVLTTSGIRTDLARLMAALLESPELLGGTDPAQLEAALAQFEGMGVTVDIVMAESTASMTTWFDPAAGIVVRAVLETPMTMTMAMRGVPGGDVDVVMEASTTQRLDLAT